MKSQDLPVAKLGVLLLSFMMQVTSALLCFGIHQRDSESLLSWQYEKFS